MVVYGKEFYFGQGILIAEPGTTHHGPPLEIIDLGVTEIPEEVFYEYLGELRNTYTPESYHLLDHNCNHFSDEVVGFLNGSQIPNHIRRLPSDFLATPFGKMLHPKLDAFFGASRSQNLAPTNSLGTVGATDTAPTLNLPKVEALRPKSLNELQDLISTSKGVLVLVEKPNCTTASTTQTHLMERILAYGNGQVKLAIVTTSKPLPEGRVEDRQTVMVQFFAGGVEVGRTENLGPNVLDFEFKNLLSFLSLTDSRLLLKPLVAKLALKVSKNPKFAQPNVSKQAFLEVSRVGAAELGDGWEQVESRKFNAFDGGDLVAKLEPLLSLAETLEPSPAQVLLDGIAHLMRHPSLSAPFAEYANSPHVLDALVKAFEANDSIKPSILHLALNLFSSYSSTKFCTCLRFPLNASNPSPLVSFGKLAILALTQPDLVTLGAKLAFNLALNLPITFSTAVMDFYGLEEGEVWVLEWLSSILGAIAESTDADLVVLLVETLVTAKLRLTLTPLNQLISSLLATCDLQATLPSKLGSWDLTPNSRDFIALAMAYLTHQP